MFRDFLGSARTPQNSSLVDKVLNLLEDGWTGEELTGDLELMQDYYCGQRDHWQAQGNAQCAATYQSLWDLAS